jgi:hypothetical protein
MSGAGATHTVGRWTSGARPERPGPKVQERET